jgi:hypothetical protein
MILDQAVTYLSHYFGSGCWLLFSVFWRRLLVAVPIISEQSVDYFSIILDQAVGYCSHFFTKIMGRVTNKLINNNVNSNQQVDPK